MKITVVILDCGHRKEYPPRRPPIPAIGDEHACYSSCDHVPFGGKPRRVVRVEQGEEDQT